MNLNTLSSDFNDYKLLDSGASYKLEEICGVRVIRPSPQAIWKKRLPESEWDKAIGHCLRTKDGAGQWQYKKPIPNDLNLSYQAATFQLKFTSFGHCGIFFEQAPIWKLLVTEVSQFKGKYNRAPRVMNLFGYTGAASILMSLAGAEVWHVDSSKGVLDWGKKSAELSKAGNIRWIHDDVQKFLIQQYNKKQIFDGVLADPPSWGHGAKKEVWEFDKHISTLVERIHLSLNKESAFFLLSSHTHGVQQQALVNLLNDQRKWKNISCGELGVEHFKDQRILPAGIYSFATC